MLYLAYRLPGWLREHFDSGQTLVEYAFILILVAIMLILGITLVKNQLSTMYSQISSSLVPPA